jgi:hypothetical protein
MNLWLKRFLWGVCLSVAVRAGGIHVTGKAAPDRITRITVPLVHPGTNDGKPAPCALMQARDAQGFLQAYYMDVDSVTCGDGACEVIPVRLRWDALGTFHSYTLPAGGALTKQGHQEFSAADHDKLRSILADPYSPLMHVKIDQVTAPDQAVQEVDAVTGATPLAQQASVVPGAVYTSYTLWHWVNSPAKTIRVLTERDCPDAQLARYLAVDTEAFVMFALEQLEKRKICDQPLLDTLMHRMRTGSDTLLDAALHYLQSPPAAQDPNRYYGAIESLFASAAEPKRIRYLESLLATPLPAPAGFYDRFSSHLTALETYYEVHLLLNLMAERNPGSEMVMRRALLLLDGKKFFIARRAYYALQDQTLTAPQRRHLEAFRQRYQDRL